MIKYISIIYTMFVFLCLSSTEMSMQREKRREDSTKGASTIRRRTPDQPPPTHTRLHPLNPPTIPPQMTYQPHPSASPPETPPPKAPPLYPKPDPITPPPKMPTLLDPPPLPNPGPSTPPPKIPTPNPTPLTALPPPPPPPPKKKKKKKKIFLNIIIKKKKKNSHIGVGASLSALAVATLVWEAGERKPTRLLVATLVWEPRAGGKGGDPPFSDDDLERTRNETA